MPIPEELSNYDNLVVYRYETDGTLTMLNTMVNGDKVEFETNHFSTYVILDKKNITNTEEITTNSNKQSKNPEVSKNEASTSNKLPQTGMIGSDMIFLLGILVIVSGIYFINRKKRIN